MSQRDLANGTVSASYVSMLESGARVPTPEVVRDLARALGISVVDLLGDTVSVVEERVRRDDGGLLDRLLGQAAFAVGDLEYARARADDAFEHSLRSGSTAQILESGMHFQRVLGRTNELARRAEVLGTVQRTAEAAGLDEVYISITIEMASAVRDKGDLVFAKRLVDSALGRLPGSALVGTAEEVRLYGVQISVDCELSDFERAERTVAPMIEIATKLDNRHVLGGAHWVAAVALARIGRPAGALGHLNEATNLLTGSTSVLDWLQFCHASASVLLEVGGELERAQSLLAEARAAQQMLRLDSVTKLDVLHARLHLAAGRAREAIAICAEVADLEGEMMALDRIRLHRTYAEAAEKIGDIGIARQQLRVLAEVAERNGSLAVAVQAWKKLDSLS